MRVFEVKQDKEGALLQGRTYQWQKTLVGGFIVGEGLYPGDRLVVVPAGETLQDTNELTAKIHDLEDTIADMHATIERLKGEVHELEEMVTAEQERANGNGGDAYRYLGENNILAANIRELEEEIERLSAELREARAEPTVQELCRAYGDWLKRTGWDAESTTLELFVTGGGRAQNDVGARRDLISWPPVDNPVAVIDAACRPEPEPEPTEVKINFGTMSPELTAEVKQFLTERGLMK